MTQDTRHTVKGTCEAARCIVCLKAMGSEDARWKVHFRGADYSVCCPSCVQIFNRSPQQFLRQP